MPARPLMNVNAINLLLDAELTADPNEADRARPPAVAYAIWPPLAAPVVPPGAVPNASVIVLADAIRAPCSALVGDASALNSPPPPTEARMIS